MEAQLIQDETDPNSYRVEAIDDDGGCEVAIFAGPNALDAPSHLLVVSITRVGPTQRDGPHGTLDTRQGHP